MRVTVHIHDVLAVQLKEMAASQSRSVSAAVATAIERYLAEEKRRRLGAQVLDLAGKVKVAPDAEMMVDEGRHDARP